MIGKKRNNVAVAIFAIAALALSACAAVGDDSSSSGGEETTATMKNGTLRFAMGSPGEAQIAVWDEVAAAYELANPGMTVEMDYVDDDLYQTIGLPNLLSGRAAPDIYFEWAGSRLVERNNGGYAADVSEYVDGGVLSGIWADSAFSSGEIDGKYLLVPHKADVTNVLWYNVDIFDEVGISPPTTWDEMLNTCDALNAAGYIPMATGNKDLWAAGNWLGHMSSRVVGEDVYDSALAQRSSFGDPEWVEAFGYIKEMVDRGCVNDSANAIADNEGAQLFFQGAAAMHPIGSWLVSWAIDEAPDLNFDYVNLPSMPGAGDQNSVIGVLTGYVINEMSEFKNEAAALLAMANNEEFVAKFIAAGATPLALSAADAQLDARTASLNSMLGGSQSLVGPPDTDYDLKVADAFYRAVATVLGGVSTPEEAAANLAAEVD
jgi:raffinose/stachyose/melibiose transport system substrate-binding protein|tara:strand:- start:1809 stop:3107 length:1299 start_codon:yes stop_codon:yes gene_type:complete